MRSIVIFIAAALVSFSASAKNNRIGPIKEKQTDADLTVLGIIVGKSKLSDVSEKLKGNEIFSGKSVALLCYKGKDDTTIAFESSETGGKDHIVTSIQIYADKEKYKFDEHCSPSVLTAQDAIAPSGILVGMSSDDAIKLKGKPRPTHITPTLVQYLYEAKEKRREVKSLLNLWLAHGHINRIEISKTVTK